MGNSRSYLSDQIIHEAEEDVKGIPHMDMQHNKIMRNAGKRFNEEGFRIYTHATLLIDNELQLNHARVIDTCLVIFGHAFVVQDVQKYKGLYDAYNIHGDCPEEVAEVIKSYKKKRKVAGSVKGGEKINVEEIRRSKKRSKSRKDVTCSK